MDDIEEICDQLQPTWEKCNEFASHNGVALPDDDKSKAQNRGRILIGRALFSIKNKDDSLRAQDIVRALKSIRFRGTAKWSQERPG